MFRSDDPYGEALDMHLDTMVRDSFFQVFGSFHLASMPRQALPRLFTIDAQDDETAGAPTGASSEQNRRANGRQTSRDNDPAWFRVSPEQPPAGVAIPEGKTFQQLFSGDNAANVRDWPKVTHHVSGNKTRMCVHGGSCLLSHLPFSRLDADTQRVVKERLLRVYR